MKKIINHRTLKCKKCKAENAYYVVIRPDDFVPLKVFICWYCKSKNTINAETGEYTS